MHSHFESCMAASAHSIASVGKISFYRRACACKKVFYLGLNNMNLDLNIRFTIRLFLIS